MAGVTFAGLRVVPFLASQRLAAALPTCSSGFGAKKKGRQPEHRWDHQSLLYLV